MIPGRAEVLVEAGANVHAATADGDGALHICFARKHDRVAEYLYGLGARPCPLSAGCMQCKLSTRLLKRRAAAVANEKPPGPAPTLREDRDTVLEQEFGSISLQDEIDKLKALDGGGGFGGFGDRRVNTSFGGLEEAFASSKAERAERADHGENSWGSSPKNKEGGGGGGASGDRVQKKPKPKKKKKKKKKR